LSFNGGRGLGWWRRRWRRHRLLGRGLWDAVYDFGVVFNNLQYTIEAFVNIKRRNFINKLWLRFLPRDLLGHMKTILLLQMTVFQLLGIKRQQ
jgi:hypothetical protein